MSAYGLCPGPGKLCVICVCNILLQSSCQAYSLLPAYSRMGWGGTRGSSHPFHAILQREGKSLDEMLGLLLHLSIPRANLEVELSKKGPHCDVGEPPRTQCHSGHTAGTEGRLGQLGHSPRQVSTTHCTLEARPYQGLLLIQSVPGNHRCCRSKNKQNHSPAGGTPSVAHRNNFQNILKI